MTRRNSLTSSCTRLSVAPLLTIIVRGTLFSSGSAACGGGAWPFFLFGWTCCFFGSSFVGAAGRPGCACVRDFFLRPPLRGMAVLLLCSLQAVVLLTRWRKRFVAPIAAAMRQYASARSWLYVHSGGVRRANWLLACCTKAFRSLAICLQKLPECPQRALLPGGTPSRIRQIHFFLDLGKTGWRC